MDGRIYGGADGEKKDRVRRTLRRVIVTAAFVSCVLFIWHNSMESAVDSSGRSGRVLEIVNGILEPVGRDLLTERFVRKFAHFLEYGAEGVLAVLLFEAYRFRPKKGFWVLLCIGLATALIDESIQFFSPGRAPGILDVCLDLEGFICGMFFAAIVHAKHIRAGRTEVDAE